MSKKLFTVLTSTFLALPVLAHHGDEDLWQPHTPIQGVGDVTKTAPTGANSNILHYGGTGTPETANIEIDLSNAKDEDCDEQKGIIENAGLDETQTDWTCSPNPGTITDGGVATTFTPGNTVKSNITVKAKVFENTSHSVVSGHVEDPVEKTWGGDSNPNTLTTFMVEMHIQPHGKTYHEDDPANYRSLGGKTNTDLELPVIGWTGIGATPGVTPTPAHSGSNQQDITMQTIAVSDNGAVSGMMGAIEYTPEFVCSGRLTVVINIAGGQPPSATAGAVAAGFTAAWNPYAGAAVLAATWTFGSGCYANYMIAGESVIENAGAKKTFEESGSDSIFSKTVGLSSLSQSHKQSITVPDYTCDMSYDIKTQLQAEDDTWICEIQAKLRTYRNFEGEIDTGAMSWRSTRPTYVP